MPTKPILLDSTGQSILSALEAKTPILEAIAQANPVGKTKGIASDFSASTAYAAGDYVFYDGTLYRFTADHAAGAWIGTDAVAAIIMDDLVSVRETLYDTASIAYGGAMSLDVGDFEQGNWGYSKKAASAKRIRCNRLIPVTEGSVLTVLHPTLDLYIGRLATPYSTSYPQSSGWQTPSNDPYVFTATGDGYLAIILRGGNNSGADITVADYDCTISMLMSQVALTYTDVSGLSSFGVADLPVNTYTYTQLSANHVFTDLPSGMEGTEHVYISKERFSNNVALNFITVCDVLNGITYRATNRDAGALPAYLWPWKRIMTSDDEEKIDATFGLISENTDNLFDIRQVTPSNSNVSVTVAGNSFEVKAATAAVYSNATVTLVLDANTKYSLSAVKNTIAGASGVYYAESSDGGSTYGLYSPLIGYTAEDDVINAKSFTTTTGYVKLGFFCSDSDAAAGDAVFSDVMLCKGTVQLYVPPLTAVDYVARNGLAQQTNLKTCNIFKKVLCVGDSYTAGWINTSGTGATHKDWSWPTFAELITGNTYVNCGVSGASSLSWLSNANGLAAAQTAGVVQAYIVQLMINDALTESVRIPVGSASDIGDENPTTFYGAYSKVIRELHAISPDAIIFVCTCPFSSAIPSGYQQAVRDIAEVYAETYHVHLLDMKRDEKLFKNASLTGDKINHHYTAVGYEQFAEIYTYYISNYINAHIGDFQGVCDIPYDS